MNKNPFLPTPSYTPQQPPLPPGPPPPQPTQPDYSQWWAGAAAAQQGHAQQAAPYNPQWTAPQPVRPPAEQSALYANYGYGNQGNWQRHQQQQLQQQQHQQQQHQQHQQHQHQQHQQHLQHQQYHAPPVVQQPPPPPPPQAYNPYQPAVGYSQPYVPQAVPPPQPVVQPVYPHPVAQPQLFASPAVPQHPSRPQQPTQPRHHASPQHPPAKRQRFDGPSGNRHHHNQPHHPQPPPPQFQPPPAPLQNTGNFSGPHRTGIPSGPSGRGGAPSGPGGRGGMQGARGGRGGSMPGGRGGSSGGRGRGGSFVAAGGGGGRGGSGGSQPTGPANRHGPRGFGNKDFHNRRGGSGGGGGGSFNSGTGGSGYSHSSSSSFRGRNQGHTGSGRTNRGDGNALGSRDGTMSSSFGSKRDENRRTLTDFKIIGLSIPELGWTWGTIPSSPTEEGADEAVKPASQDDKAEGAVEESKEIGASNAEGNESEPKAAQAPLSEVVEMADAQASQTTDSSPPPSRIRFYFHTPVTADDSRPIPHNASYGDIPTDTRKGKRKKLEDDDGDLEDLRAPPPPPQMAGGGDDHASVAGSVAPSVETASEADWLMAAIVEGEEAAAELHPEEDESEEAEHLQISQIVNEDEHGVPEGDDDHDARDVDEGLFDGTSRDDMAGIVHDSLEVAGADDLGDAQNGSAEDTSLFTGSPGRASQAEGEHLADSSAANDSHEPSAATFSSVHPSKSSADLAADHPELIETQIQPEMSQQSTLKSLQSLSAEPTLLDIETQDISQHFDSSSLSNGHQPTQIIEPEHLPEPPESPSVSNMAFEDSSSMVSKSDSKAGKTPSANRLSISYARSNRRLVIDAEVVENIKLFRNDGRIEATIKIQKQDDGSPKGILTEGLSNVTKSYSPLPAPSEGTSEQDPTVPPFTKTGLSTLQLLVYLDTVRPLSEPKWAKSGDVQDWLKSMFGRMFWVAGDAAAGWEKKIHVVDPDPPPTIWTVLEGWVTNSPVGALNERQRFLKTHMSDIDNILEILLRLVRGERATPFSQTNPTISAPSVSGPLLSALTPGSAHGAQQTHVSLAVLALFRLTTEFSVKALGEKGKTEAEERVGEIIRCLPSHLIYKSLDGIFKEWRVEKKGR